LPLNYTLTNTFGDPAGTSLNVTAVLKDASGQQIQSNALTLTVGPDPVKLVPTASGNEPTFTVLSLPPSGTSYLEHAGLTIAGTVSDPTSSPVTVRIVIAGTEVGSVAAAPNGSFSTQVFMPNVKEFTPTKVSVYAVDQASNISAESKTLINIVKDTQKPVITGVLSDPLQTQAIAGADLALHPTATDNVGVASLVTKVTMDNSVINTFSRRYSDNATVREQHPTQKVDATMMGKTLVVTTTATDFAGNSIVATANVDVMSVYQLAQSGTGRPLPGVITQLATLGGNLYGVFTINRTDTVSESFLFAATDAPGGLWRFSMWCRLNPSLLLWWRMPAIFTPSQKTGRSWSSILRRPPPWRSPRRARFRWWSLPLRRCRKASRSPAVTIPPTDDAGGLGSFSSGRSSGGNIRFQRLPECGGARAVHLCCDRQRDRRVGSPAQQGEVVLRVGSGQDVAPAGRADGGQWELRETGRRRRSADQHG